MLTKALYLLLVPSALIAVLSFCATARVSVLWKWMSWVVFLTATIVGGQYAFDGWAITPALILLVVIWSMLATFIIMRRGPLGLLKMIREEQSRERESDRTS
jgi:hypothetical protein